MTIRVIKFFVTCFQNRYIDLKGFIKIRSMLDYSVSIKRVLVGGELEEMNM